MVTTYTGGLGTTVTVRALTSPLTVGFDTTVALIGESSDSGSVSPNTVEELTDRSTANDLFGESSEVAKAFTAANKNGAGTIYGVGVDTAATSPYQDATREVVEQARYVVPCSNTVSDVTGALAAVNNVADALTFSRVIAPGDDVAVSDIGTYSPAATDQRYVEVAPGTCEVDDGETTFTAAAVAGYASTEPLGSSVTFDELTVSSLGVEYLRTEVGDFTGVTAVTKDGVVADMVTSSDQDAFSDVFQMEIVDAVVQAVDAIAQDYAGDRPNTPDDRKSLERTVAQTLGPLADQSPPLLSDADGGAAYATETSALSNDTVALTVSVSPVDVMKQIDVTFNVGSNIVVDSVSA